MAKNSGNAPFDIYFVIKNPKKNKKQKTKGAYSIWTKVDDDGWTDDGRLGIG